MAHNSQFELLFLMAQGILPRHVECTMQGAGLMLGVHRRSLAKATEVYLSWQMPKDLQVSDWGAAALSDDQLAYAALDAVVALLLWQKLERDLKSEGRWDADMLQRDAVAAAVEMAWPGVAWGSILLRWMNRLQRGTPSWLPPEPPGRKKQGRPRPASQLMSGAGFRVAWMRRTWRTGPEPRKLVCWPSAPATSNGRRTCPPCTRCYRSGAWRNYCRRLGRA